VLGWGLTDMSDPNSAPSNLMAAYMPLRPYTACSRRIANYNPYLMLCAGDDYNAAVCSGDSGGPLMTEDPATGVFYIAGVTSYGQPCKLVGSASVFANVAGATLGGFVSTYAKQLQDAADATVSQTRAAP
jgi:secreted trypsin-like serine protease